MTATKKRRAPKKLDHSHGRQRRFVSIPMTDAMVDAIERTARRLGINRTNFMRLHVLKATDYDADQDADLEGVISERSV